MIAELHGIKIIIEKHLPNGDYAFKVPSSKSKRIRNKWRKKYPKILVKPIPLMYETPFGIICNEVAYEKIQREFSNSNKVGE